MAIVFHVINKSPAIMYYPFINYISKILAVLTLSGSVVFAAHAVDSKSKPQKIVVGGDYAYPPYEFIDKYNKQTGFNVELSQEIAAVMGIQIEISLGKWDEIRALFDRGEIDIVQGMVVSKEREQQYVFSPNHSYVNQAIFARKDSPTFNTLSDLSQRQVIVQSNGNMYDILTNLVPDIDLITVDTHADALRLLSSGQYDYAAVANLPSLYLSKELGLNNIKPVYSIANTNKYSYAVKKGNEALLAQFTQGLAILKNTGRHQILYEKWFGAPANQPWKQIGLSAALLSLVMLFVVTVIMIWNKALRQKVESRTAELANKQLQLLHADKMASLGVLVSGVAHEINNPCGILTLNFPFVRDVFAQMEEILDEYDQQHDGIMLAGIAYTRLKTVLPETLEDMHNASRKIRAIVDDLKHHTRKDSVEIELNEVLDLNALVKMSLRLMSNTIAESTDNLEVYYSKDMPLFKGSSQKIEQVIINLINNACQALTNKTQKVVIRTLADNRGKNVIFAITDQGVGIKEEDICKLTDPFFTSKREQGGTGLGLSISAGIVRDHQGILSFHSTLGKGTIVKLSLPLEHVKDEE